MPEEPAVTFFEVVVDPSSIDEFSDYKQPVILGHTLLESDSSASSHRYRSH